MLEKLKLSIMKWITECEVKSIFEVKAGKVNDVEVERRNGSISD